MHIIVHVLFIRACRDSFLEVRSKPEKLPRRTAQIHHAPTTPRRTEHFLPRLVIKRRVKRCRWREATLRPRSCRRRLRRARTTTRNLRKHLEPFPCEAARGPRHTLGRRSGKMRRRVSSSAPGTIGNGLILLNRTGRARRKSRRSACFRDNLPSRCALAGVQHRLGRSLSKSCQSR